MAYVTHLQLVQRPGVQELSRQASPDVGELVDPELLAATLLNKSRDEWLPEDIERADIAKARIDAAITDADALIDGYLQRGGYTTPLLPVPALVVQWSRSITRYLLHRDLVAKEGDADPVLRDYRDTLKRLQEVADGRLMLGVSLPKPSSPISSPVIRPGKTTLRDALRDF